MSYKVELNVSSDAISAGIFNPNILIVGEKMSAGSAETGILQDINSKAQAKILFGAQSPIYQAIDLAFNISNNRFNSTYKPFIKAIGYNITGTAGVKKITITGTPNNEIIEFFICDAYKYRLKIETTSADTLVDVANKLISAINSLQDLPAVATLSGTNDVNITAVMPGAWFNQFPFRTVSNSSNLTFSISQTTAGTGNIDTSTFLTQIQGKRFDYIAWGAPETTISSEIKTELANRSARLINRSLAGILSVQVVDTALNIVDKLDEYKTQNAINFLIQGKSGALNELPIVAVTRLCLARCKRIPGCYIGDFVPNAEVTNNAGNPSYIATTLDNVVLLNARPLYENFTEEELELLRQENITLVENNITGQKAVYTNDKMTIKENLDGDVEVMQLVANRDSINLISSYLVDKVYDEFKGKTFTSGEVQDNTQQENIQTIISSIMRRIENLATKDFETGLTLGLIPNNTLLFAQIEDMIAENLSVDAINGVITLSFISEIVSAIMGIIINIKFKK